MLASAESNSLVKPYHAICLDCASHHGLNGPGSGPYTCPVCRQPLSDPEVCKQFLRPSEEWKSVALCGLSPTAVMECAGRALSFWSYQMTNQILCQQQANKSLQLHCAKIEQEVDSIWSQGNTRISALTAKIKDMELEEQGLRRKCEDLRLSVAEKNKKLAQSQELYNKLKRRLSKPQSQYLPSQRRGMTPEYTTQ
ncbi:hypothetical protein B0T22DRAFT_535637 [Podospora appendiculata]|uniref:RING-type domain-containing protein n=1 Tax=Podospora appendiculata TaxID=314037 RepID=A0AAE0X9B1_9PEZI|nr:hypothetical protein B0T22DRAFT_535637 [Podospora appendiculata]